jgi:ferredoxin-fold anticodon binding domain-containing protein
MSTRQLRITGHAQIRSRIHEFRGKEINIVLTDSTVMFGTLTTIKENHLILKNMRQKEMEYSLSNITEIYRDTKD